MEATLHGKVEEQSADLVRRLGTICALGVSPEPEPPFQWKTALFKGIRVMFAFSSSWTAWERGVVLIGRDDFPTDSIISHRLPMTEWRTAFELMTAGQALKIVLRPE